MDTDTHVQVSVLSDRNATVAEVIYDDPLATYFEPLSTATGSSKREPGDLYDERIAYDLAIGRALVKLGNQLRRNAEKAVKKANQSCASSA